MKDKNILFDFLNDINYNKKYILTEENKKEYNPYIINRFLSGTVDNIWYVNEINMKANLDKDIHYNFLMNTIRKRKRFVKWLKPEKIKDLELVKDYYGLSYLKAKKILDLHNKEQIKYIKKRLERGGVKKK